MTAVYIIALIVGIVLHLYASSVAAGIASDKGYTEGKWFHICFWFSVFGFIIVAAMPDLKARELQNETNKLLKQIAEGQSTVANGASVKRQSDVASYLPEL